MNLVPAHIHTKTVFGQCDSLATHTHTHTRDVDVLRVCKSEMFVQQLGGVIGATQMPPLKLLFLCLNLRKQNERVLFD